MTMISPPPLEIFPSVEKIENINDQYWTLRAEEIPGEEKSLGLHDPLINVYHFTRDSNLNQMQVQNFGEPFFLVIKEGETLADIKIHIQKKLQVPDDEFSKWKFAFISLGYPEYLQDSEIVSYRFQRRDIYVAWEQYLGLEHSDASPKQAYMTNQNRETNLVAVSATRRLNNPASTSVPPWRNLQPDEFTNNQLYEKNKPSVVFIENLGPAPCFGSGFIWDTKGHIVTNYHVIQGASDISVTLADETGYKAKVVGCDLDNDVAVLCIDAREEKLTPIKVGISSNLLIGQKAYAIGHPFGWGYTFTDGMISGLRSPACGLQDAIQTTVSINRGSSGGPLLDSSGYLIGMNTVIWSPSGAFCGVAFAVAVDTVKGIVEKLVK